MHETEGFAIEDFGHVLAIAFTLSAIFYYVELRELAIERLKQTLDAFETAIGRAEEKLNISSLTTKWLLRRSTSGAISSVKVYTHVLVVLSTSVSLGSLIYSGFHPHEKYGGGAITFILLLSFLSIIWNLVLYFLLLPKLTRVAASLSRSDHTPLKEG